MRKTAGPLFEHACHEGNRGLYNTLVGARLEDRKAADAPVEDGFEMHAGDRFLTRVTVVAIVAWVAVAMTLVTAQTPGYKAPRAPDGKPNLNGIWQAMNTANWDIEAHSAAPESRAASSAPRAPFPAGLGVVEGGELPYRPEALAKTKREPRQSAEARSRGQVLSARRAAGHLHAVPVSDHPEPEARHARSRVRWRRPDGLHDRSGRGTGRQLDGLVERTLGRGDAGRRHDGVQRPELVRSCRQLPQRRAARGGTLHRSRSADTLIYEVTIEDPKVFTRPWKMSMPLYRRVEPNAQILEFRCVEFVEDLMYGHLAETAEQ